MCLSFLRPLKGLNVRPLRLHQTCRDLEDDGSVHQDDVQKVPPQVEYSLTDYGKTLRPITEVMCEGGQKDSRRIMAKMKQRLCGCMTGIGDRN